MGRMSAVPPGWKYNPSGWSYRLPVILLSLIGLVIAGYLTSFQLQLQQNVWEPFFGDGSFRVLTSFISQSLPIPDAALGVLAYLFDAVLETLGGDDRWRSRPWLVLVLAVGVGFFALASLGLLVLQAFILHAWCTLCIASALISFLLVWPVMNEASASFQYLRERRRLRI
jgi:uncharacterized membrane protein